MATYSSGSLIRNPNRSLDTGRFITADLIFTLRSGRHIYSSVGKEHTRISLFNELLNELFFEFNIDLSDAFIEGIEAAVNEMIIKLIPTVAMKTGALRNTIQGLLYSIKNTIQIFQFDLLQIVSSQPTEFRATIDFQQVWSALHYSIYHEIAWWTIDHGRNFYLEPTVKGTFPYSIEIFVALFRNVTVVMTNNWMELAGWDIYAGPLGSIQSFEALTNMGAIL